jgi:hypothetical protein
VRRIALMGGRRSLAAPAWGLPAAARMRVASRAGLFILTGEREPRQGHGEMNLAAKVIARSLSRPQRFCRLIAIAL